MAERTALPEDSKTDDDVNGTGGPGTEAFFEQMRVEERQRREIADAFSCQASAPPSMADTEEVQRKHANQIAQLYRTVGRLRKNLLISNLVTGSVLVALLAAAAYSYLRSDNNQPIPEQLSSAGQREFETGFDDQVYQAIEPYLGFQIRTDIDRKYQLMIRELYENVMEIHRPDVSIDIANAARDDYVQFMADVSLVSEEAARDQPSAEIMQAIVNLALIGREMRTVENRRDLSIVTKNRIEQINSVIRARDVRNVRNLSSEEGTAPH